jgi:S-adenosylmethionine hydrolase
MPGVIPLSRREGDVLVAEVTWVDRYGNCQLNVSPEDVAEWGDVLSLSCTTATGESVTRSVQRATSFEGIGGGLGLVLDSYGMLAVCMRQRSAADELRLAAGDSVQLQAAVGVATPGVTVAVQLGTRGSNERR